MQEISHLVPSAEETGGEERLRCKPAIIYHCVFAEETFEQTVQILSELLKGTQERFPGLPRHLYLDIEGHRKENGDFDRDMWELQRHFLLEVIGPYITELSMPLIHVRMPKQQRNDVPDVFEILPPDYPLGKAVSDFGGQDIYVGDAEAWVRFDQGNNG